MTISAVGSASAPALAATKTAIPAAAPPAATTSNAATAAPTTGKDTDASGKAPPPPPPAAPAKGLIKTGNGEYTAASVGADQKDAQALGLIKQKDGNYAARAAQPEAAPKSAAATSSAGVQAALSGLTLGG